MTHDEDDDADAKDHGESKPQSCENNSKNRSMKNDQDEDYGGSEKQNNNDDDGARREMEEEEEDRTARTGTLEAVHVVDPEMREFMKFMTPHVESRHAPHICWSSAQRWTEHIGLDEKDYDEEPDGKNDTEKREISLELYGWRSSNTYATNVEWTGLVPWFGSMHLCHWLWHRQDQWINEDACGDSSNAALLELGCGTGRAGIVASQILQQHAERCRRPNKKMVILTDGEAFMVQLTNFNCQVNGLSVEEQKQNNNNNNNNNNSGNSDNNNDDKEGTNTAASAPPTVTVSCRTLQWGDKDQIQALLQDYPDGFPLVLGADLLYGSGEAPLRSLLYTVQHLLHKTRGLFVCAVTRRGGFSWRHHLRTLAQQDYQLHVWEYPHYTRDIFDNVLEAHDDDEEESLFWRDAIFGFQHETCSRPIPTTTTTTTLADY